MVYGKRFKKERVQTPGRGTRPGRRRPRIDSLQSSSGAHPIFDGHGAYLFQLLLQLSTMSDLQCTRANQLVNLILQEMDILEQDLKPDHDQDTLALFAQIKSDLDA